MADFDYPLDVKVLAAAAGLLGLYLARRWLHNCNNDVPSIVKPGGAHWLWGHEKLAWETPNSQFYLENIEGKGSVLALKGALFHPDILAVADPAALNHIFTKHAYDYIKSPVFRPTLFRVAGYSLAWVEGDQHKRQRQLLSPIFTHERVKHMDDVIRRSTDAVIEKLRDHCSSRSGSDSTNVNILEWSSRLSLDVIGAVGFGYDYRCGEAPEAKAFKDAWAGIVSLALELPAFVGPVIIRAFPWINSLPIKQLEKQGDVRKIIRELGKRIYLDRQRSGAKNEKDLLTPLLKLEASGTSFDEILDQIVGFTMAGTETTSTTIALGLFELAKNQDFQRRLREEVNEYQGSGPGGEATYAELQTKLPLLDAFCKETLRFWPSIMQPERMATKDDVIRLSFPVQTKSGYTDTLRIKKGQIIIVPSIVVNRNTRMWGEDAHEFRPDRWLDPKGMPSTLTSGVFGTFAFNEGPRTCIAWRLAIFEMKVAFINLVKNFEFTPTADKVEVMVAATTIQPFVAGKKDAGVQLPLNIKVID